ncbi:hypothetical protein AFAE65S_02949 [Alcaligenes phenolicus]
MVECSISVCLVQQREQGEADLMSGSLRSSGLTRVGGSLWVAEPIPALPAHERDYCRSSSAISSLLWIVRLK